MKLWGLLPAMLLALLAGAAAAQTPTPEPNRAGSQPLPTVTFDLVFPQAAPAHYVITVDSSGHAAYQSDDATAGDARANPGTPYTLRFAVTEATRTRIFALTQQLDYFQGSFNYTRRRVADTGTKTLTYSEGPADSPASPTRGKTQATTFNYSENPAIQQLTAIFQGIASSAELAGRLDHLRRFDRLELDAALKRAEEMAHDGQLLELQVAAPALHSVVDDPAAMNLARQRAQRLLRLAQSEPPR